MVTFRLSRKKNKKYDVKYKGKLISFGDKRYQHYFDKIGQYSHLNHEDKERRRLYRLRASKITDKYGNLTYLNKFSPNYWAYNYLW